MPAADAATQKCGGGCVSLAALKFGAKTVVSVSRGSSAVLALFWFSGNEDLHGKPVGTVQALYRAHLIAQSVDKTYGADLVYEYEWFPKGFGTVLCLGVSGSMQPGTPVTLQPCGVSAATLWIAQTGRQSGNYMPLINAGASVNSALVLTASSASGALSIAQMALSTTAGVTSCAPTQMWELVAGPFGNSTELPPAP